MPVQSTHPDPPATNPGQGPADTVAVADAPFESPPAAPAPPRQEFDPHARLRQLALELVRTRNRRLLIEYLRLRRAAR